MQINLIYIDEYEYLRMNAYMKKKIKIILVQMTFYFVKCLFSIFFFFFKRFVQILEMNQNIAAKIYELEFAAKPKRISRPHRISDDELYNMFCSVNKNFFS